jgi:hypothetical protein
MSTEAATTAPAATPAPGSISVPAPELNVPAAPAAPPAEGASHQSDAEKAPPAEGAPEAEKSTDEERDRRKRASQDRFRRIYAEGQAAKREAAYYKSEYQRLIQPLVPDEQRDTLDPVTEQNVTIREAVRAERAEEMRQAAQRRAYEASVLRRAQLEAKLEEARDRMPDFDNVFHDDLPVTETMADIIAESDRAVEIAYYLGKNPDQAARIANMPPHWQGTELARIEARLQSAPTVRKATTAPPPVPIVSGTPSAAVKTPDQMTAGDFAEWWRNRGRS